jgi:hypothetical protein
MRRAGFRRGFPQNTALLVGFGPVFVLIIFGAWFRWELPPLQSYYLKTYWECSKGASNAGNTSEIQWLYKSASGRKSVPVIPHDVEFSGAGFLPVALSPAARQDGWTQLVKLPPQTWPSPELEAFFQRDLYDGRTFSQVIAQPMFLVCIVPFIFLFGVIYLWHDIAEEWRQLYAGPFGDDLIFDFPVIKERFIASFNGWKEGRNDSLKARSYNSGRNAEQTTIERANATSFQSIESSLLSTVKPIVQAASPVKPTRRSIFPGAQAQQNGDKASHPWDESQWIE